MNDTDPTNLQKSVIIRIIGVYNYILLLYFRNIQAFQPLMISFLSLSQYMVLPSRYALVPK